MRVVGGRLRGRALVAPKDADVRPTSDRVREAVFNILEHGIDDFSLTGANVLDLFAGTGALGIEALSRGAAQAVFVDNAAASRALLQANFEALGLGGIATIYRRSALDLGAAYRKLSFQLVFADPPYAPEQLEPLLPDVVRLLDSGRLSLFVLEHDAAEPVEDALSPFAASLSTQTRRHGRGAFTVIARRA